MKHLFFKNKSIKAAVIGAAVLVGVSTVFAGKMSQLTADYYRGMYDSFEGKWITLDVTHVTPSHFKSAIPGIECFTAHTFDSKQKLPGGPIIVAVPKAEAMSFVTIYGNAPDITTTPPKNKNDMANMRTPKTNTMAGVMTADAKRFWFVDYAGKCKLLMDVRTQSLVGGENKDGGDKGKGNCDNSDKNKDKVNNGDTPKDNNRDKSKNK